MKPNFMHKQRFLIFLALNAIVTLAAPPWSWFAPICTVLIAPLVFGVLTARFMPEQPILGRALRLVAVIGLSAVLRPYWWAVVLDNGDFSLHNEPEVEVTIALIQFVLAGAAFLIGSLSRREATA